MNGKLTISRVTSNVEKDYIRLRMEDDLSGVTFLDAKMSLEDFAKALMGMGYTDCEFELCPKHVGMKRESKIELVPLDDPFFATDESRRLALEPFEVDGWRARQSDIKNNHNYARQGDGKYKVEVVFTRFVDA